MPMKETDTIEKLIFYQYAKLIVRSAKKHNDGKKAKSSDFGLIRAKYNELVNGKLKWSDILREDIQFAESDKMCAYCGCTVGITLDHIVPKTLAINEKCASCDKIQAVHNIIYACKSCNSSKGTRGLYSFYQKIHDGNNKFYDYIPPLLEKKYLKTIWNCHNCNNTLQRQNENGFSVLDLDIVLYTPVMAGRI